MSYRLLLVTTVLSALILGYFIGRLDGLVRIQKFLETHTQELITPSTTNLVDIGYKLYPEPIYVQGVNDALDTIALLNLEQHLINTNRSFGEMSEIVCSRLHVPRTNPFEKR